MLVVEFQRGGGGGGKEIETAIGKSDSEILCTVCLCDDVFVYHS